MKTKPTLTLARGLALSAALAFVPATHAAEAIANGGFESPGGNGTAPTNWTADFNSYGTFSGAAHSGSWGLHAGSLSNSGGSYQDITTEVGVTYIVSAWAQNFGSAAGSSHLDVLIGTPGDGSHTFTFPNYNTLHTTTKFASDVTDNSFLVGGAWQQYTFTFTATGTTTRIGLYNSYKAGDSFHSIDVDDVSVASLNDLVWTLSPADNAGAVAKDANLVITFNQDVQAVAGKNIVIMSDATTLETISVTSSQVTISGTLVTINPTANLPLDTACHVLIDAGAFTTTSTATFDGITDPTAWNFTSAGFNGGFESPGGNGTAPTNWTADFNSYGTFSGAAHSGSWGLHAGSLSNSGGSYQDITTEVGVTYIVSAWAQNFGSAAGSSHLDVLIGTPGDGSHTFTFPNYNTLHTTTKFASDVTDNSFLVGGAWQQYTFTFTATGTTTRIGLYNSYKAGDTVHSINVDDVSVVPGVAHYITASVSGSGGTISPSGAVLVVDGADQTFTITPDAHYAIADVVVGGVSQPAAVSSGSYTFSGVSGDDTIVASFSALPTHTITASVSGSGGSISPSGAVVVDDGASQMFTITPDANYAIAQVLVDGVNNPAAVSSGSYTFSANNADHTITASFTATGSDYDSWASDNGATGQTPEEDHDNDGVENGIEYFMGQTGSSFTVMPGLDETNTITWPKGAGFLGTWQVQTSPDLGTWTNVVGTDNGSSVSYLLPSGAPGGKSFVRLLVTPTP